VIHIWYKFIDLLPFAWTNYEFMKNALLAVVIITPCFGLIGTMIVGNRMAFFSDVIGHSALTGVAIGVILGLVDVRPAMIIFAVILSIVVNIILEKTKASSDTVMGVFAAITAALGIALLSRGGSFNKYTVYLIGDILSVTPDEIFYIIEQCSNGPFLELFARGTRENWTLWGNEANADYVPDWPTYKNASSPATQMSIMW